MNNKFLREKANLPKVKCSKCKVEYNFNDNNSEYGLWFKEKLLRCGNCHSDMKYKFWVQYAIEEDQGL